MDQAMSLLTQIQENNYGMLQHQKTQWKALTDQQTDGADKAYTSLKWNEDTLKLDISPTDK